MTAGVTRTVGGLLVVLGRPVIASVMVFALAIEIGFWGVAGWLYGSPLRFGAVLGQIVDIGWKGLRLAALFAIAIGLVIALQIETALGFADLLEPLLNGLGTALTREVTPPLIGILVAARSGTSLTAGLGGMQVNKEIDALQAMGLNPVPFLITPVAVGMSIALPILMLFMVGFTVIAVSVYLNATVGAPYLRVIVQTIEGITGGDVVVGVGKCFVFAIEIATIGAAAGLSTRGSADSIGIHVTRAVVAAITTVLLTNAAITLIFPS